MIVQYARMFVYQPTSFYVFSLQQVTHTDGFLNDGWITGGGTDGRIFDMVLVGREDGLHVGR